MNLPKIGIVIPCFNGWIYTKNCINSILKSHYLNYEIFIVNDGSTDNTSNSLAVEFPKIVVYNGNGNLWWSESMNKGIELAISRHVDFVLVLNNDIEISVNTLEVLVNYALKNNDTIIGSLVRSLNESNDIWSSGGKMIWPWPGEVQLTTLDNFHNNTLLVDWNPGMGTLIPVNIIKKLNGFDSKNFPQYMGDVDFCLRAKKDGYSILITSESVILNNVDNTGGLKLENDNLSLKEIFEVFRSYRSPDLLRARLIFMLRHCPIQWLLPALFLRYTRLFIYLLKRVK